jgi:hypothetical protein
MINKIMFLQQLIIFIGILDLIHINATNQDLIFFWLIFFLPLFFIIGLSLMFYGEF